MTPQVRPTLAFTLSTDKLAVANEDGHKVIEAGMEYDIVFTDLCIHACD